VIVTEILAAGHPLVLQTYAPTPRPQPVVGARRGGASSQRSSRPPAGSVLPVGGSPPSPRAPSGFGRRLSHGCRSSGAFSGNVTPPTAGRRLSFTRDVRTPGSAALRSQAIVRQGFLRSTASRRANDLLGHPSSPPAFSALAGTTLASRFVDPWEGLGELCLTQDVPCTRDGGIAWGVLCIAVDWSADVSDRCRPHSAGQCRLPPRFG
jgi:hypothetical protein